jgi:alpha-beta hydrolase superfamily lysophospholipase
MKIRLALACLIVTSVGAGMASGQTILAEGPLPTTPIALFPPEITSPNDAAPYLERMADNHGYIDSKGACLFYRFWAPPPETASDSVVLLLHGIGGHSGNFRAVAQELNKSGLTVYALDARGHGLSCGRREHIPDIPTENSDIAAMLDYLRQTYPHFKQYLMAESMGGVFALNYASKNGGVSGLILLSPAVAIHDHQWRQWGTFRFLPDLLFSPDKPSIPLQGRVPQKGEIKNQFNATLPPDPLSYKSVSVNYVLEAHQAASHWQDNAPTVIVPTLLVRPSNDPLISPPASKEFFKLIGARDKQARIIENAPHNLLSDQKTPEVLAIVTEWILKHSAAETAKSTTQH